MGTWRDIPGIEDALVGRPAREAVGVVPAREQPDYGTSDPTRARADLEAAVVKRLGQDGVPTGRSNELAPAYADDLIGTSDEPPIVSVWESLGHAVARQRLPGVRVEAPEGPSPAARVEELRADLERAKAMRSSTSSTERRAWDAAVSRLSGALADEQMLLNASPAQIEASRRSRSELLTDYSAVPGAADGIIIPTETGIGQVLRVAGGALAAPTQEAASRLQRAHGEIGDALGRAVEGVPVVEDVVDVLRLPGATGSSQGRARHRTAASGMPGAQFIVDAASRVEQGRGAELVESAVRHASADEGTAEWAARLANAATIGARLVANQFGVDVDLVQRLSDGTPDLGEDSRAMAAARGLDFVGEVVVPWEGVWLSAVGLAGKAGTSARIGKNTPLGMRGAMMTALGGEVVDVGAAIEDAVRAEWRAGREPMVNAELLEAAEALAASEHRVTMADLYAEATGQVQRPVSAERLEVPPPRAQGAAPADLDPSARIEPSPTVRAALEGAEAPPQPVIDLPARAAPNIGAESVARAALPPPLSMRVALGVSGPGYLRPGLAGLTPPRAPGMMPRSPLADAALAPPARRPSPRPAQSAPPAPRRAAVPDGPPARSRQEAAELWTRLVGEAGRRLARSRMGDDALVMLGSNVGLPAAVTRGEFGRASRAAARSMDAAGVGADYISESVAAGRFAPTPEQAAALDRLWNGSREVNRARERVRIRGQGTSTPAERVMPTPDWTTAEAYQQLIDVLRVDEVGRSAHARYALPEALPFARQLAADLLSDGANSLRQPGPALAAMLGRATATALDVVRDIVSMRPVRWMQGVGVDRLPRRTAKPVSDTLSRTLRHIEGVGQEVLDEVRLAHQLALRDGAATSVDDVLARTLAEAWEPTFRPAIPVLRALSEKMPAPEVVIDMARSVGIDVDDARYAVEVGGDVDPERVLTYLRDVWVEEQLDLLEALGKARRTPSGDTILRMAQGLRIDVSPFRSDPTATTPPKAFALRPDPAVEIKVAGRSTYRGSPYLPVDPDLDTAALWAHMKGDWRKLRRAEVRTVQRGVRWRNKVEKDPSAALELAASVGIDLTDEAFQAPLIVTPDASQVWLHLGGAWRRTTEASMRRSVVGLWRALAPRMPTDVEILNRRGNVIAVYEAFADRGIQGAREAFLPLVQSPDVLESDNAQAAFRFLVDQRARQLFVRAAADLAAMGLDVPSDLQRSVDAWMTGAPLDPVSKLRVERIMGAWGVTSPMDVAARAPKYVQASEARAAADELVASLPDHVAQLLGRAANTAQVNLSDVLARTLGPDGAPRIAARGNRVTEMGRTVLDVVMRLRAGAVTYGIGPIINTSFHVWNTLHAPFQMSMSMGMGQTLAALAVPLRPRLSGVHREVMGRVLQAAMKVDLGSYWGHNPDASARGFVDQVGRPWTVDDIEQIIHRYGIDTSRARVETARAMVRDIAALDDPSVASVIAEVAPALAHSEEAHFRTSILLSELDRGADVADAARMAREGMFDYGKASDWEKVNVRKWVRFYSFMRANFERTLTAMFADYGRVGQQARMLRDDERLSERDELRRMGEWTEDEGAMAIAVAGRVRRRMSTGDVALDPRYSGYTLGSSELPMAGALLQMYDVANVVGSIAGVPQYMRGNTAVQSTQRFAGMLDPFVATVIGIPAEAELSSGRSLDMSKVWIVPHDIVDADAATGGTLASVFGWQKVPDRSLARTAGRGYSWMVTTPGARAGWAIAMDGLGLQRPIKQILMAQHAVSPREWEEGWVEAAQFAGIKVNPRVTREEAIDQLGRRAVGEIEDVRRAMAIDE